jgi:hypothetical protein
MQAALRDRLYQLRKSYKYSTPNQVMEEVGDLNTPAK